MGLDIDALLRPTAPKLRLDLGCGEHKQEGFVGIDRLPLPGVDIVWDLESYPWCGDVHLPDGCAEMVMASHLVEHIDPARGGFLRWMDEVWRVTDVGGVFLIACPYAGTRSFFQDPTHLNAVNEVTFCYFDPADQMYDGRLWAIYRPKPWRIKDIHWDESESLEVALVKRDESEIPAERIDHGPRWVPDA